MNASQISELHKPKFLDKNNKKNKLKPNKLFSIDSQKQQIRDIKQFTNIMY